jgi:spermidine/putrescine-binding protein
MHIDENIKFTRALPIWSDRIHSGACTGVTQASAPNLSSTQAPANAARESQVLNVHNWDTYIDPAI